MPLRELEQLFVNPASNKYDKGQIVLFSGDKLKDVYFVKSGYIKMYSITEEGDERILIIFPPNTAFPIAPRVLSAPEYELHYFYQALTNARLLAVPRQQFDQLLKKNEQAARLTLNYIAGLSEDLINRLSIIENKEAKNKIANLLPYLISIGGKEIAPEQFKINFRLTHQDIAAMAGLTRETASTMIKSLEDEGVLSQQKGGVLLINQNLIPV